MDINLLPDHSSQNQKLEFLPDIQNHNHIKSVFPEDIRIFSDKIDPELSKYPFKISGLMDTWPAYNENKWNFEFLLEKFGFRSTVVEKGRKYTDEDWEQKVITIYEYLELLKEQDLKKENLPKLWEEQKLISQSAGKSHFSNYYLAQNALLTQIPRLLDDIDIPEFIATINPDPEINCWFGPAATFTPFHTDPKDNVFCQVSGTKYFKLRFENDPKNRFYCFLNSGESLFIPAGWEHQVMSKTKSFGVNFWM